MFTWNMAWVRGTQPHARLCPPPPTPGPEGAQDFLGNRSPGERPELPHLPQALGFPGNLGFFFCPEELPFPRWEEKASGSSAPGQGPRCRLSVPRTTQASRAACPSQNQPCVPWKEAQSPVVSWSPQMPLPEPMVWGAREKVEMLLSG